LKILLDVLIVTSTFYVKFFKTCSNKRMCVCCDLFYCCMF